MKHIIFLILLTLGVWAQEVGVPYVDTQEAVAQSAALSPDGETFYTYANNTLTHWSLNPVKVLESVKIEDFDMGKVPMMFIADNKKIVFANFKKGLTIFDFTTKQFVARDETKLYRVNLINNKIVNVNNQRIITQWNPENLQIIKQVQLPEVHLNCDECSDFVETVMHYGNDNAFTIASQSRFALINNETLELLDQKVSYNKSLQISNDHQYAFNGDTIINIRNLKSAEKIDTLKLGFHNKIAIRPPSFNHNLFTSNRAFHSMKSNDIRANLYVGNNLLNFRT